MHRETYERLGWGRREAEIDRFLGVRDLLDELES